MIRATLLYTSATIGVLIGVTLLRRYARRTTVAGKGAAPIAGQTAPFASGAAQDRVPEARPVPVKRALRSSVEIEASPPRAHRPELGAEILAHLHQLETRGAPGLAAHVIAVFVHDTTARLTELREAVVRKDGNAAHRAAHTLHGSASMVGAMSLERGCAEIIREVRNGSFERCEAVIAELEADFESIRRAVTA